jgi:hypothetical protein
MLLWELLQNELPFCDLTNAKVVELVSNGGEARPAFQPTFPAELRDLIESCWHSDPESRCSFEEILTVLRELELLPDLSAWMTITIVKSDYFSGLLTFNEWLKHS